MTSDEGINDEGTFRTDAPLSSSVPSGVHDGELSSSICVNGVFVFERFAETARTADSILSSRFLSMPRIVQ